MSDKGTKRKPGIGDFLEGLNGLLELVTKLQDSGEDSLNKTGEFKTDSGVSGVYGVQIKTVQGGSPVFEQFGNISRKQGGPLLQDEREPLVDMFEDGNQITIVAEIPGASEETIIVTIEDHHLTLSASCRDRKYRKEFNLPAAANSEPLKRSYVNGIFSIVIMKSSEAVPT